MALDHLFHYHRFTEHPFETWMAEDESDALRHWFVDPPFLQALLGDIGGQKRALQASSDLVFGKRGTGKTALRIRLEQELLDRTTNALVVRYSDFSPALAHASKPLLGVHVEELLRLATIELIAQLAEAPERQESLQEIEREELVGLVRHYYENLTPDARQRYTNDLTPRSKRLAELAKKTGKGLVDVYNGVVSIMNREKITPTSWANERTERTIDRAFPLTRLQRFWNVASAAGVESVWVLVDGIDEAPDVRTPQQIFDCVAEMLLSQRLMEFRSGTSQVICFKIFLTHPRELRDLLRTQDFRFDRITVHEIAPKEKDLDTALGRRLGHFSNGHILNFDQICDKELNGTHTHLVQASRGHPRTLFRAAHEIMSVFNRTDTLSRTHLDRDSIDEGLRVALDAMQAAVPPD